MLSNRFPFVWTVISAVALIALVGFVFLGTTLAAGLSGMATYLVMLGASAVLATVMALPALLASKSRLGDKHPA